MKKNGILLPESLVSGCHFVFLPLGICVDFQKCVDFWFRLKKCVDLRRFFSFVDYWFFCRPPTFSSFGQALLLLTFLVFLLPANLPSQSTEYISDLRCQYTGGMTPSIRLFYKGSSRFGQSYFRQNSEHVFNELFHRKVMNSQAGRHLPMRSVELSTNSHGIFNAQIY